MEQKDEEGKGGMYLVCYISRFNHFPLLVMVSDIASRKSDMFTCEREKHRRGGIVMAVLLNTSGGRDNVTPINGNFFSLRELQKYVGGYIERIDLNNGCAMYVDEEGLFKNLPCNRNATMALEKAGIIHGNYIVGNAVVVQYREER